MKFRGPAQSAILYAKQEIILSKKFLLYSIEKTDRRIKNHSWKLCKASFNMQTWCTSYRILLSSHSLQGCRSLHCKNGLGDYHLEEDMYHIDAYNSIPLT